MVCYYSYINKTHETSKRIVFMFAANFAADALNPALGVDFGEEINGSTAQTKTTL